MTSRILVAAAVLSAGVLTHAQQQVSPSTAAAPVPPSPEQVNNQVRMFEITLRGAVERAATSFAKRVREALPDFRSELMFINEPLATGVVIPEVGVVFHVQIPGLSTTDQIIMSNMYDRRKPVTRVVPDPAAGVVPVSERPVSGAAAAVLSGFEPDKEYSNLTRESLYDALLDSALTLPIPEGLSLTVFAGELLPPGTNPLAERSRLLVLTIKAEDLLALRLTKITRDQARERIKESRFGG